MPENINNIFNKGFDGLNKMADKTSPKYKSYNLIPLAFGVFILFLILITFDIFSDDKIEKWHYVTFGTVSISSLFIYALSAFAHDYLRLKFRETETNAYNQTYDNRNKYD